MSLTGARYFKRFDTPTSLFLTLPLFLLYQVGVLLAPATAGADVVTWAVLASVGGQRFAYIGVLFLLSAGLVLWAWLANKRRPLPTDLFLPVLLESGIYALTMGTLIVVVMVDLLGVDPRLAMAPELGFFGAVIVSLGAGFHEEVVFRQFLFPGLWFLMSKTYKSHQLAMVIAAVLSSLLFAAAHHLGAFGEPWRLGAFVYRTLAGLMFVVLFRWRGLAVTAWTHALYDVYVVFLGQWS